MSYPEKQHHTNRVILLLVPELAHISTQHCIMPWHWWCVGSGGHVAPQISESMAGHKCRLQPGWSQSLAAALAAAQIVPPRYSGSTELCPPTGSTYALPMCHGNRKTSSRTLGCLQVLDHVIYCSSTWCSIVQTESSFLYPAANSMLKSELAMRKACEQNTQPSSHRERLNLWKQLKRVSKERYTL